MIKVYMLENEWDLNNEYFWCELLRNAKQSSRLPQRGTIMHLRITQKSSGDIVKNLMHE